MEPGVLLLCILVFPVPRLHISSPEEKKANHYKMMNADSRVVFDHRK
jgi:hypothetical protein